MPRTADSNSTERIFVSPISANCVSKFRLASVCFLVPSNVYIPVSLSFLQPRRTNHLPSVYLASCGNRGSSSERLFGASSKADSCIHPIKNVAVFIGTLRDRGDQLLMILSCCIFIFFTLNEGTFCLLHYVGCRVSCDCKCINVMAYMFCCFMWA